MDPKALQLWLRQARELGAKHEQADVKLSPRTDQIERQKDGESFSLQTSGLVWVVLQ